MLSLSALVACVLGAPPQASASGESAECGHSAAYHRLFKAGKMPSILQTQDSPVGTDVLTNSLDIEAIPASSTIAGSNTMTVKVLQSPITSFRFRLSNNFTISSLKLDGRDITFVQETADTVRADFDRAYNPDEVFTLYIQYSGVATSGGNFGSVTFTTQGGSPAIYTLSEPWYSYTWWPAKDDNNDKAIDSIAVTVPNTLKVAANGTLQGTDVIAGNKLKYRWATTYPMADYLLCFSATNYNTWQQTFTHANGTMPVLFYIYPGSDNSTNRTNWEKCLQMLATYAPLFGPYPFINEKYGIYQFGFNGGMEHQTFTGQGTFSESVTSHELGHQWWGDMCTCKTWHDIWLNEGFATYVEALWLENKPGSTGLPALKAAMASRKPTSFNGSVYVYDSTNESAVFSSNFVYRKGGWALHQLRHVVGNTNFFAILAAYRQQYQYDSATTDDFINVAEAVYGQDLNWFFDKIVYANGVPQYQWGWQTTAVNGKNYALVYIKQVQSASYPIFTLPIDIRPTVGGVAQPLSVWNDAQTENYVLPISGPATANSFDPDGWNLNSGVASVAYVPGPPKIVQTVPTPGGLAVRPTQVKVTFHTPVNVAAGNFAVVGRRTGSQAFSFSYDAPNNTAVLTFPHYLASDRYTVSVSDLITAVNSGQRLDGEIANPGSPSSLPSGNGQAMGSASFYFQAKSDTIPNGG